MVPTVPALIRRRLASLALVALLGAAIAAPGAATATGSGDVDLSSYETAMVAALNADRTSRGLVAVRVDPRLMEIARARSDDMVAKHYFDHRQPDGRNVFDILSASHITWFSAGEIIATNNYAMDLTISVANRQWMESAGHKAIIVSTNYNYVGVGLAIDPITGNKLWTAVFLKGPDRTAARVTVYTPTIASGPTVSSRRVQIGRAHV